MADIPRRSLDKFTYAPIRPSPDDEESGAVDMRVRGLDKVALASALQVRPNEVAAISSGGDGAGRVGEVLSIILEATAPATARATWRKLADLSTQDLVAAGNALATYRRERRAELAKQADGLTADYADYLRSSIGMGPILGTAMSEAPDWREAGQLTALPTSARDPRLTPANLKPSFSGALDWVRVDDPNRADALVAAARDLVGHRTDISPYTSAIDWDRFTGAVIATLDDTGDWTQQLTDGFDERMKVEPIGRLHLERIDMTPVGAVRGELLHSIGFAPGETVTVIHREWSSREVDFEKVVTDEFEQTAEDSVTENTELVSATDTTARHSTALSMEASGSGSYGFGSASTSVGYNSTSDDETAKKDSRNHSVSVTRKASARTRKEHKTTFTIKQQAGVEDQSVRTITNSSPTDPMRVDLHQLIRDWRVDLYRYGLRLTYDIVVPSPGIDLLANVDELRRIDHQLGQTFTFSLLPSDITRDKWPSLAAKYGADVPPPDPETLLLAQEHAYPERSEADAKPPQFDTLAFDVPSGYVVRQASFAAYFILYPDGHFDVMEDNAAAIGHNEGDPLRSYIVSLDQLIGRSGHLTVIMFSEGLQSGYANAALEVAQDGEAWRAWQNTAWDAMRKGAEDLWRQQQQELQQRRDKLADDIANWDPLTLRRMEREEVMKTTLKWIFGPAFSLTPSDVLSLYGGDLDGLDRLDPSGLTPEQWASVLGFGEFIKFIHEAIEWENVLFFVYPYFWDSPRNHALKLFLKHPDDQHQQFLRGGAARVVLTVRPGFEESFTRLFETADPNGNLDPHHPYLTIAQEIENYAATHYPGIPGAVNGHAPDPDAVEKAERGELIAEWHEYTPISATDITVNTPLSELK
jgi:hypothetical protein